MAMTRWPGVLALTASLLLPALAAADDVRIRAAVANVREEGSARGKVLFQVKGGDRLRLLDAAGDWLHVEAADGRRGFVSRTVADVIPAAPAPPPLAAAPAPPATSGTFAIEHKEVACIVGDRYPRLDACFQPKGELGNAKVLFRAGDSGPWYAVDLMPEGACYVAYLPKPLATTTEIEYYVDAVDKAFNPRQQPETAPEAPYRARVVRNPGDCESLQRVAASVKKVAKPILVAAGRTKGGAPAVLGAILVGFSQEGVVLATAAAAAGAGAVGATAAGVGAAGSGGGIGTGTLVIAGGVVAAGALVAVVAGGGDEGAEPSTCTARDVAAQSGGAIVAIDSQTLCSAPPIACGRPGLTLRTCITGVCTDACTLYYELSDARRFPCGAVPNCFSSSAAAITDPTFCLSAAQQAAQACQ